jgi:hypothetical protein
VLTVNLFNHPEAKQGPWSSAMTYKIVGAIQDLGHLSGYKVKALLIGLGIGLVINAVRKGLHASAAYRRFIQGSRTGFAVGWVMDSVLLASPYASAFGAFVDLPVALWFGVGGIFTSLWNTFTAPSQAAQKADTELPSDMSTTSLVGGGLIAGESLYFLLVGLAGLVSLV